MNRAVLDRAVLGCANIGIADVGNVGVMGAYDDTEVKPYIKGHVTDGSSTFTFTVNGNQSVTVPVDTNGNWKWVVDRTITKLEKAFQNITNIDSLTIVYKENTITSLYMAFQGCSVEYLDISKLNTSNVRTWGQAFNNMPNCDYSFVPHLNTESAIDLYQSFLCMGTNKQKTLDLRNIETKNVTGNGTYVGISRQVWSNNYLETLHLGRFAAYSKHSACTVLVSQAGYPNLANVTAKVIAIDMDFKATAKLTEQSVVNLFNAVAADIVLTFHQNVWNMIMREIDVQGSLIQVAYQNMIDNYDVTIANASFDAEIEYIEGTGTQWIDTGVLFNENMEYAVRFLGTGNDSVRRHIIGNWKLGNRYRLSTMESTITLYWWYGNTSDIQVFNIDYHNNITDFVASVNNIKFYQNDIKIKDYDVTVDFLQNNETIKLFFDDSSNYEKFIGRFYYLKIWDNGNLVADFIPVRKGTTGYMYDKVSGNLFGNSGTGDFILGNDK